MLSQKEILDMIATEAIEGARQRANYEIKRKRKGRTIKYGLRLIRKRNGTLEWKD